MGTLRPSAGFTFGRQDDIRQQAARRGWLTLFQEFNQQYTAVTNKQLDMQASVSLIPDLTIDLSANRVFAETYAENYRVSPGAMDYQSLNPYTFGNFTISTVLVRTAFSANDAAFSETFEQFRENRLEVARRLAGESGFDPNNTDAEGYPVGYGKSSQQVLIPAFLAAYTGGDAGSVQNRSFQKYTVA
jgi:cell surface protein SprA